MSTTRTPSAGTAKRIASRKRSAVASSAPQASARTPASRSASASSPPRSRERRGERARDLARVARELHVDAVVDERLERDRDQRRRGCGWAKFCVCTPSRSEPIASTTSASSHSRPAAATCGGSPTAEGWPGGRIPAAP